MSPQQLIERLDAIKTQYSKDRATEKFQLLNELAQADWTKIKVIPTLHDMLLFLKVYADNESVYHQANHNLKLLSDTILQLHQKQKQLNTLNNTGIAHTSIEAAYNFDILRVMIEKYIFFLEFDSFGADDETLFNTFQLIVSEGEQVAFTDDTFDIQTWIKQSLSSNAKDKLAQIIQLIENSTNNERMKTHFFQNLQLFVRINLNDHFSRTFLTTPFSFDYFYTPTTGLEKHIDFKELIRKPLQEPLVLLREQKQQLIDVAQTQLFCLLRELDAITYAEDHSVEVLPLERGLYICLYYQKIHKRNLVESLIGYTVLKNGVSISYGAFWILGYTAKVAFNIFEAFRGGESQFIFSQIIRILVQHYHVNRLIVEPYQFGKNNEEAILSGAFWFYYKLGFRPTDIELAHLASKEQQKITKTKSYKTSTNVLEQLAEGNLELSLASSSVPSINPTDVSLYIGYLIEQQFNGNRQQLENKMSKELLDALEIRILSSAASLTETESFKKTSVLFYDMIAEIKTWSDTDKTALFHLMKIKLAGNEREFILKFQQHKVLQYALFDMLQKRPKN